MIDFIFFLSVGQQSTFNFKIKLFSNLLAKAETFPSVVVSFLQ